ncbi:MAG: glycosyltransferase family 4 protein, partial [Gammaproteobacteria bacterium]|nr:glycosyltransferase family 4 protein [Gammaproteobacteria bacterium]
PTDMSALVGAGGVKAEKSRMIRGSGVDLDKYTVAPEPQSDLVIIMASRLLKDKGVYEFVEAARKIKAKGIKVRFQLVGEPDLGNPESVTHDDIQGWRTEGIVECLGYRTDIAELFSGANIVVLPSYYGEGLPKVLIEAAACGRAVITTDMPGCRDAIEPGLTGMLVPARDAISLKNAMVSLLEDPITRQKMGLEGRDLAEREFSIDSVVSIHLDIYRELENMVNG